MCPMPYVRPDWVRRLNAMGSSYVGGPAAMVALDADALLSSACTVTGLADFGDPDWEEPYRRLVDALEGEADLTVVGRLMCRHDVLRHLCTRLVLVDELRRDPAIAETPVVAPVVVTGPARSGTSILHELLAEDPALRAPLAYEMAYPPVGAPAEDRVRRGWAESEFDVWGDVQPEFRAVHELAAHLPEECLWLMAPAFDLGFWATCADIPSFAAWRAFTDPIPTYRFHRSFLQVLQTRDDRTWVLKSPVHLSRLGALFAVYPDARVICTHRDPARTIPSAVSAVAMGRWLRSDAVEADAVATSVAFGFTMMLNALGEQRAALPDVRTTDVHYTDLVRDPVATIASAYDALDLEFASEQGDRITRYLDARPATKYGVHRYAPEDFGLDASQIRADLAPYIEAYDVVPETAS